MTSLKFKKGPSFTAYENGCIYFEKNTGLIKVGTGATTCDAFGGNVKDAYFDEGAKKLIITLNNSETPITLNFGDCASATLLGNVLIKIGLTAQGELNWSDGVFDGTAPTSIKAGVEQAMTVARAAASSGVQSIGGETGEVILGDGLSSTGGQVFIDFGNVESSNTTKPVTGKAVLDKIGDLTGGLSFKGVVNVLPSVSGSKAGDMVVLTGGKEYIFADGAWVELGDESLAGTLVNGLSEKAIVNQTNKGTLVKVSLAGKVGEPTLSVDETALNAALNGKQASLSTTQLEAVNSGITATKVSTYDGYAATINSKVTANTAITGSTKCKISYDSKGLVTAGADLTASDIPALDISKITNLQTTLNGKQNNLSFEGEYSATNKVTTKSYVDNAITEAFVWSSFE